MYHYIKTEYPRGEPSLIDVTNSSGKKIQKLLRFQKSMNPKSLSYSLLSDVELEHLYAEN